MQVNKHIRRRKIIDSDRPFSDSLHPLLQRLYRAREIVDDSQLKRDLTLLSPPKQMKGVDQAVDRLILAFTQQQRIIVIGDFDADGATSTALMLLALQAMGHSQVRFLLPNRFDYGYGLTPEIVDLAARQNPGLIVTVDNGITSLAGVQHAQQLGIDVIITDHHLAGDQLPLASAIVNPNQPGCTFPSKNLAGVGVAFYLMMALRSALRESQWFETQGIVEPNMAQYLDLVALGTVADVVPLDQHNRILVHQGIQRIRAGRARPGILALLQVARRQHQGIVASDLGFSVGPRLNAAGRLDDMTHGVACLLCEDPMLAEDMAQELDDLNSDRRQIEQTMQNEAMAIIGQLHFSDEVGGNSDLPKALCLFDPGWHQGVVGILASRVKERFHRPVIAFACGEQGDELKGSARSINGIHLRDVLAAIDARHPGLIDKFGGHAMAAGLTIQKEKLAVFERALLEQLEIITNDSLFEPVIVTDGALAEKDFNLFVAQLIRDAGPWGQQFPEPLFDGEFFIVQQRLVGEKHLKLVLALDASRQFLLDAIAFHVDPQRWPDPSVERLRLAYRLDINEYRQQKTLQLMIEYFEPLASVT